MPNGKTFFCLEVDYSLTTERYWGRRVDWYLPPHLIMTWGEILGEEKTQFDCDFSASPTSQFFFLIL